MLAWSTTFTARRSFQGESLLTISVDRTSAIYVNYARAT